MHFIIIISLPRFNHIGSLVSVLNLTSLDKKFILFCLIPITSFFIHITKPVLIKMYNLTMATAGEAIRSSIDKTVKYETLVKT